MNVIITIDAVIGLDESVGYTLVTDAPSVIDASDYAVVCESMTPENLEWIRHVEGVIERDRDALYTVSSASILKDDYFKVLKQYIDPIKFNQQELNESGNYLEYKNKRG